MSPLQTQGRVFPAIVQLITQITLIRFASQVLLLPLIAKDDCKLEREAWRPGCRFVFTLNGQSHPTALQLHTSPLEISLCTEGSLNSMVWNTIKRYVLPDDLWRAVLAGMRKVVFYIKLTALSLVILCPLTLTVLFVFITGLSITRWLRSVCPRLPSTVVGWTLISPTGSDWMWTSVISLVGLRLGLLGLEENAFALNTIIAFINIILDLSVVPFKLLFISPTPFSRLFNSVLNCMAIW